MPSRAAQQRAKRRAEQAAAAGGAAAGGAVAAADGAQKMVDEDVKADVKELTQGMQSVAIQQTPATTPATTTTTQAPSRRAPRQGSGRPLAPIDVATAMDQKYLHNSKVDIKGNVYASASSWASLFSGREGILDGIAALGWPHPSGIQSEVLPQIIQPNPEGKWLNLKAQAIPGSGKTGTFVLAMLARTDFKRNEPQAICVCPTRELANQEADVMEQLGQYCGIQVCRAVKPGPGQKDDVSRITAHFVVGTPGSIMFRIKKRALNTKTVNMMVIDEADNVLSSDGLAVGTKNIKKNLPRNVQVLLFSATFPRRIESKIQAFLGRSPKIEINVKPEGDHKIKNVQHFYINCSQRGKLELLKDVYDVATEVGQSIIFCNRKDTAHALQSTLVDDGFKVDVLVGDMRPDARDNTMRAFRERKTNVLISTNLIGRGIDVPAVKMVVNYDFPMHWGSRSNEPDAEGYKHRIGRAGRFGRKGVGINLLEQKHELTMVKGVCQKFDLELLSLPNNDYEALEQRVEACLAGNFEEKVEEKKEEEKKASA